MAAPKVDYNPARVTISLEARHVLHNKVANVVAIPQCMEECGVYEILRFIDEEMLTADNRRLLTCVARCLIRAREGVQGASKEEEA